MSERVEGIEILLRQALAPVEPPADLELQLEDTLGQIVELAAEELEAWELSAMRDPRNWPRAAAGPAVAVVAGSAAAAGLVVVRTRRKRHNRRAVSATRAELAERTVRDLVHEAHRLLDAAARRL
jgi:hypothetical protein